MSSISSSSHPAKFMTLLGNCEGSETTQSYIHALVCPRSITASATRKDQDITFAGDRRRGRRSHPISTNPRKESYDCDLFSLRGAENVNLDISDLPPVCSLINVALLLIGFCVSREYQETGRLEFVNRGQYLRLANI